jgi:hypothetical protein
VQRTDRTGFDKTSGSAPDSATLAKYLPKWHPVVFLGCFGGTNLSQSSEVIE